MYFVALATDYDGTLAHEGKVANRTIAALEKFKKSGRKLILLTGRELPDLKQAFAEIDLFDKVVAENGALIYTRASEEERSIAPEPSMELVAELKRQGVKPLSVGRSIIATWEPHQTTVLQAIRKLGLELEIVFNKGAVMVLPSGINKATGLAAALEDLALSPHNVVGVGDAENDHAFLRECGLSAAVANAIGSLKNEAMLVTRKARGDGVAELVGKLLKHDFQICRKMGIGIRLGTHSGDEVRLLPTDTVLIAGTSGIGKSTIATALTEECAEQAYQFCVFDPEGDYDNLENAICIGDGANTPTRQQAMALLQKLGTNLVINTLGLHVDERPAFFADLLPALGRLRSQTARPHWLIMDEAHHLLPQSRENMPLVLSMELPGTILITVHPGAISADALRLVSAVVALGPRANKVIKDFCDATGLDLPREIVSPKDDQVLYWRPGDNKAPRLIKPVQPRQSRMRHSKKYAEGTLDEASSFYFRGPDDAMKLRAQNLMIFAQIAEGIDDRTWEFHLRRGDYAKWFRHQIRDKDLAEETAEAANLPLAEGRKHVLDAIRRRYTAPATAERPT